MLDDLAFGDGIGAIVRRQADGPQAIRHAKKGIEDAARALSDHTGDSRMYPLHQAIVSSLITQWIALESDHALYPPPDITSAVGVAFQDKDAVQRRYAAILRTPAGGLLGGTLKLAHDRLIRVAAQRVYDRYTPRIDYDDVLDLAYDRFDRALFRYRPDRNACFTTFVQGGLKSFLASDVRNTVSRSMLIAPADDGMLDSHPDGKREAPPGASMMAAEETAQLRRVLHTLKPREREVLRLRFGLDNGPCHTCKEIGQKLGLSKTYVHHLESLALERCRRSLSQGDLRRDIPGPGMRGR